MAATGWHLLPVPPQHTPGAQRGAGRRGRGSFSGAKWQTTLMGSSTDSTRDPALAAPPALSGSGDRAAVGVRGAVNTQEHTPCSGSGGCWGWSGHRA